MTLEYWNKRFIRRFDKDPTMPWISDLVLMGHLAGIPKCCIEFYVRCRVLSESPFAHGGTSAPREDGIVLCPRCSGDKE